MTVRATVAGLLLPVLFILGIGITSLTGQWITESSKVPAKYTDGAFEGQANPADIRGSYTFADIEAAFGIPVAVLADAFGQQDAAEPAAVQLKIFEEIYGIIDGREIGTDSMRLFVALYRGLPYESEETTGLPETSRSVLLDAGADLDGLEDRFITVGPVPEAADPAETGVSVNTGTPTDTGTPADTGHDETEEEQLVKGKTVFADLLDWGLTREEIESVLNAPMGPRTQAVRDWCLENGIEFSGVKTALQEMLDR